MAESWPTESVATVAVDSAARKIYTDWTTQAYENIGTIFPPWDLLEPTVQLQYRERVLGVVWAALTALPDPRYAAWEEGFAAGQSDATFDAVGFGADYEYHSNPYPSGL